MPKLINEIIKEVKGIDTFIPELDPLYYLKYHSKKVMRSAEEILKDYGLGGK